LQDPNIKSRNFLEKLARQQHPETIASKSSSYAIKAISRLRLRSKELVIFILKAPIE
jgi:hypothetical protein